MVILIGNIPAVPLRLFPAPVNLAQSSAEWPGSSGTFPFFFANFVEGATEGSFERGAARPPPG